MDWRIKGAIQKVLGVLPGGARAHALLQRRRGGLADFDGECDEKVEDWRLMMGRLRGAGARIAGGTLLEIGTGWYPTFPLCLHLAGAGRILTLDLNRLLDPALTLRLAERLARHAPAIAAAAGVPAQDVAARLGAVAGALRAGASLEAATRGAVEYRAPADGARTGLAAGSVDVVLSNNVLEHVPRAVIHALLAEGLRVLRPGGVAFHAVNCGDHYAYVDPSIDQLNYLRYSEAAWRFWNNRFLYQNRLRAADLTGLARRAGYAVEVDTSRPRPDRLARIDAMLASGEIAPCFAGYPREQLAITSVDFLARKPLAAGGATASPGPRS